MEKCLKNLLEMQELTDIISCILSVHMKKNYHQIMMEAAVVIIQYY